MEIEKKALEDFCAVYASAVVRYLETEVAQGLDYDETKSKFFAVPLDDGSSPTDFPIVVGRDWPIVAGKFHGPLKPDDPGFNSEEAGHAIYDQLLSSRTKIVEQLLRQITIFEAQERRVSVQ